MTATVVLDASVVIKWLLRDPEREAATDQATALMENIVAGRLAVVQPFHWLAEVAAVLCRLSPGSAAADILRIQALHLPTVSEPKIMQCACELAVRHRAHVFDTLYHAVALETPDATLVTADQRYLRATRRVGNIVPLADWPRPAKPSH